jgi:hypothetical protein
MILNGKDMDIEALIGSIGIRKQCEFVKIMFLDKEKLMDRFM